MKNDSKVNIGKKPESPDKARKSLGGSFHKYADPSLIRLEKDAWGIATEDKHRNN